MEVICTHCDKAIDVGESPTTPVVDCSHCGRPVKLSGKDSTGKAAALSAAPAEAEGFAAVARSQRRGRVEFACPKCGKRMGAPLKFAGERVACLSSKTPIAVPKLQQRPHPPPAPPPAPEAKSTHRKPPPPPGLGKTTQAAQAAQALSESADRPAPANGRGETESEMFDLPVEDESAPAKKSSGPSVGVIMTAIFAAAVILGVVVFFLSSGGGDGQEGQAGRRPVAVTGNGDGAEPAGQAPAGPTDRPTGRPADGATEAAAGGATTPGSPVGVLAVRRDVFASAGFLPARLGREYLKVTVSVEAGEDSLAFNTYGPDVTLTVGSETYESLGAATGRWAFPLHGARMSAGIPAGQNRSVAFLFDLPQTDVQVAVMEATLTINRVGEATVKVPPTLPVPDNARLAGEYVEARPRSLKPAMAGPLAEAIQRTANHRLILRTAGDQLSVELPSLGIAAKADRDGDLQRFQATYGDQAANLTLRVAQGGGWLILYLRDEPFSQLSFVSADRPVDQTASVPLTSGPDEAEPWVAGKPKPVKLSPGQVKTFEPTKPTQPPPRRRSGKTIFDF